MTFEYLGSTVGCLLPNFSFATTVPSPLEDFYIVSPNLIPVSLNIDFEIMSGLSSQTSIVRGQPPMSVRTAKPNRNSHLNDCAIRSRYYRMLGLPVDCLPPERLSPPVIPAPICPLICRLYASTDESDPSTFSTSSSASSSSCNSRALPLTTSSSSSDSTPRSSPCIPPCLRTKRSLLYTTPTKTSRVLFQTEVRVYRIPSHRDYTYEEWNNMWIDGHDLNYAKQRSIFEFQADNADWRNATEDEFFMEGPDDELIHPATWIAYRQQWERKGTCAGDRLDFASLPGRHGRRSRHHHHRRQTSWSPRPEQPKFLGGLLDLAMQTLRRGKDQDNKIQSRHEIVRNHAKPPRSMVQGYP